MEAMQAAGLTPIQVIVDSTRGGAMAMGLERVTGTLEKGKAADLIVVASDPTENVANLRKLRYVVRAGSIQTIQHLHDAASK
jgi:imidazolonepropionase-like amidohydrolase